MQWIQVRAQTLNRYKNLTKYAIFVECRLNRAFSLFLKQVGSVHRQHWQSKTPRFLFQFTCKFITGDSCCLLYLNSHFLKGICQKVIFWRQFYIWINCLLSNILREYYWEMIMSHNNSACFKLTGGPGTAKLLPTVPKTVLSIPCFPVNSVFSLTLGQPNQCT